MTIEGGQKGSNPYIAKSRTGLLILIDMVCFLVSCWVFLNRSPAIFFYRQNMYTNWYIMVTLVFLFRFIFRIYNEMWRYANSGVYLKMVLSDFIAGIAYLVVDRTTLRLQIPIANAVAAIGTGLLATLSARFIYQSIRRRSGFVKNVTTGAYKNRTNKINVGIVGAGEVGVLLANELRLKPYGEYAPYCFFDNNPRKIGSTISGIPVLGPDDNAVDIIKTLPIQEIIIALPNMDAETQKRVFDIYKKTGCRVRLYDYPLDKLDGEDAKRMIRDINIEDLLQRKPIQFDLDETRSFYTGKTILVTGGGGSIGSELCRQIARAKPKHLILLDIYENGVYDIQQELIGAYKADLKISVIIATICDRQAILDVFRKYKPHIVFHAAAHKHVPLMENNCAEAVNNNVFGTLNVIDAAEQTGVERFVMISTDKAVNPTNIMGATKRLCEIIIQSRKDSKTDFVAVRFGNVLGSNGSVVPLFKRQIAHNGPVTLTDKRIIRYFMTIPEAAQLVLRTGIRGEKAEVYVLDMGNPVSILELAENMISLSGYVPYRDIDIVEIGLRPGEKLYEELLTNRDTVCMTEDDRIYIDHDEEFSREDVEETLQLLRESIDLCGENQSVRDAMMKAVSTYRHADIVNEEADKSIEMQSACKSNQHLAPGMPE